MNISSALRGWKAFRMPARILCVLFLMAAARSLFADGMTECTIDGTQYKKIFDVHETGDGRIAILYHVGGVTTERANLSKEFLSSWGLDSTAPARNATPAAQPSVDWYHASEANEMEALLNAGLIRRIGTAIYNVNKAPGWDTLANAKVMAMTRAGLVLDVPNRPSDSRFALVINYPMTQGISDTVTLQAKFTGFIKEQVKGYGMQTVSSYDYGVVMTRKELPPEAITMAAIYASTNGGASAWNAGRTVAKADDADTKSAKGSGSGFFVSADGLFLTSYHVIANASRIVIKQGAKTYAAEIKKSDAVNDLALLKVEGHDFKWLALAAPVNASLGQNVFTIGYPNPSIQGFEPKYSEGTISGLDGYRDDEREYQMSVPVQPGNSGGPLCNSHGEVVGIVRAELTMNFVSLRNSAMPQNVNYAVKSKYALNLLRDAGTGITFSTDGISSRAENADAARSRAMDSAAMVLVY